MIARIEGQHWQIQQLILPELHQDCQRTFPEGWLTRKEYYRQRRQQGEISNRLKKAAATHIPDSETIPICDDDEDSDNVISEQPEQQQQDTDHHQHQRIHIPPEAHHLSNPEANKYGGQQQQQHDPQSILNSSNWAVPTDAMWIISHANT